MNFNNFKKTVYKISFPLEARESLEDLRLVLGHDYFITSELEIKSSIEDKNGQSLSGTAVLSIVKTENIKLGKMYEKPQEE